MRAIIKLILVCLFPLCAIAQQEIKFMSFNIRLDVTSDGENRWDARKERVAGLMNYYEPDFIGGQEVLHHQLQYLLQNLNGYDYIGAGRDDGKNAGEFSCIFYKKEEYTLLDQATFWLSPTPDSISKGWDAALNRVCTYGLFRHKKTRQTFWVFNTHFDHIGKTARLESAKLIMERIHELNTKLLPVIFMGDLNSRPADAPVQFVNTVMKNSRTLAKLVYGPADTWNAFKFLEKPEGCIDYIFISDEKKMTVTKFATITDSYELKYPSDHFPVMATVTIKNKAD